MQRTQHPSNNDVLGAPSGWDHERLACATLPITRTVRDGQAVVQSYWRPNDAEREAIQAGALIQLTVIGVSHPPLALEVVPA